MQDALNKNVLLMPSVNIFTAQVWPGDEKQLLLPLQIGVVLSSTTRQRGGGGGGGMV